MNPTSVSESVREWIGHVEATCAPGTLRRYARVGAEIERAYGPVSVDLITRSDIERFRQQVLARGVSRATCNSEMIAVASWMRYCEDAGYTGDTPMSKVKRLRSKEAERPRIQTSVAAAAIEKIDEPAYRIAASLALYAGLRISEVVALRWDDVHLDTGQIVVRAIKGDRPRVTVITPALRVVLECATRNSDYVVCNRWGQPHVAPSTVIAAFRTAAHAVGLRGFRFHDLRAVFCTTLLEKFAPAIVQRLAGHSNIQTTLKYYSRLDDDRACQVVLSSIAA